MWSGLLFTRFAADLWHRFNTYVRHLAPEKRNRCAKESPQDMSGRRCQKKCQIKPSKPFEIVLPCTREHSSHRCARCRKRSLNNTRLSSLWTPVPSRGVHFGPHGPSCTGPGLSGCSRNGTDGSRRPLKAPVLPWSQLFPTKARDPRSHLYIDIGYHAEIMPGRSCGDHAWEIL